MDSLSPQLAPDATTSVPSETATGTLDATTAGIRCHLLPDPFLIAEGRLHHRSPIQLARRVDELEREDARKANLLSDQADEIARLAVALARTRAHEGATSNYCGEDVAYLDNASRDATGSHREVVPQASHRDAASTTQAKTWTPPAS